MKQVTLITSLVGACVFVQPLQAEPAPTAEPTLQVAYSDLDLRLPADQVRLKERLAAAARKVCPARDRGGRERILTDDPCFAAAMNVSMRRMEVAIAQAKETNAIASADRR